MHLNTNNIQRRWVQYDLHAIGFFSQKKVRIIDKKRNQWEKNFLWGSKLSKEAGELTPLNINVAEKFLLFSEVSKRLLITAFTSEHNKGRSAVFWYLKMGGFEILLARNKSVWQNVCEQFVKSQSDVSLSTRCKVLFRKLRDFFRKVVRLKILTSESQFLFIFFITCTACIIPKGTY